MIAVLLSPSNSSITSRARRQRMTNTVTPAALSPTALVHVDSRLLANVVQGLFGRCRQRHRHLLFHHLLKVPDTLHAMQQADHQGLHRHRRTLPVAVRNRNLRRLVQGVFTGNNGHNNQPIPSYRPTPFLTSSFSTRSTLRRRLNAYKIRTRAGRKGRPQHPFIRQGLNPSKNA